MIKNLILILLLVNIMVKSDFSSESEEEEDDSGSIEIPDRPENRKEAAKDIKGSNNQNSPTFLRLISKFMGTLRSTVENTTRNAKNRLSGSGIQNAKKTLKGLQRAYILAGKAQKKFMKFFTIPKNMSKIEST